MKKVGTQDPAEIEAFVRNALANKEKIYGFGHAVLRAEDPRATIQYELGQRIAPNDPLFKTALAMRSIVVSVLSEHKKISNPYPNVDAVSGTLLNASGLTDSNFYTVLFGISRAIGVLSSLIWDRALGLPLERPKSVTTEWLRSRVEGR